jgi:hypothetical protein
LNAEKKFTVDLEGYNISSCKGKGLSRAKDGASRIFPRNQNRLAYSTDRGPGAFYMSAAIQTAFMILQHFYLPRGEE